MCVCANVTNVLFFVHPWERKKENGTSETENMLIVFIPFQHSYEHFSHFFFDKAKETRYLFVFSLLYRLGMHVLYVCVVFWSWGPIYISTIIIAHLIFPFCLFTMMLRKWKYIGWKPPHVRWFVEYPCNSVCLCGCVRMCKCRCVEHCDDFEMLIK